MTLPEVEPKGEKTIQRASIEMTNAWRLIIQQDLYDQYQKLSDDDTTAVAKGRKQLPPKKRPIGNYLRALERYCSNDEET